MKTKVKCAVALAIAILAITTFTGCPPTMPPVEKISAKEAWEIMKSAQESISEDSVPVYIQGLSMKPSSITEGKTGIWSVCFYSESENAVWEVLLNNEKDREPTLYSAEERYTDVSLTAYDLADWNIDSIEACEIATQNGAGNPVWIFLRTARLDNLEEDYSYLNTPEFISDSTKLFWMINDEKHSYFIDACTGEYLSRYAT